MTLRNRDVKVSMKRVESNDPGKDAIYHIRLVYKPTGVEVSGEGDDLDVLRSGLQKDLEELVGLEGSQADSRPDNVLEFPKEKWQADPEEAS